MNETFYVKISISISDFSMLVYHQVGVLVFTSCIILLWVCYADP